MMGTPQTDPMWTLRQAAVELDDQGVLVRELTGLEVTELWPQLKEAELTGDMLEAYTGILLRGTIHSDGEPVFHSREEIVLLPMRIIVALGEKILELSDIGVSPGNSDSVQTGSERIDSPPD